MPEGIDELLKKVFHRIFNDHHKATGENDFQHWRKPLFRGPMQNADSHAILTGDCGDTIEVFLKFENERVCDAAYLTNGCNYSSVCGSFAAEMALGKTPDEITDITGETILAKIGNFPQEEQHCATLAAATLQEALHNYMITRRQTHSIRSANQRDPVSLPRCP